MALVLTERRRNKHRNKRDRDADMEDSDKCPGRQKMTMKLSQTPAAKVKTF